MDLMTELTIFVLAAFVGFEVISKVPTTLHTPLMSRTNAIHGIVMLGGLIVDRLRRRLPRERDRAVIAIAFGTINIVGGFLVTDRMLGMFKRKPKPERLEARRSRDDPLAVLEPAATSSSSLYIVAFSLFISGCHAARTRARPARGNLIAAVGMAIAVVATLLRRRHRQLGPDHRSALAIGTAVGVLAARAGADDRDAADGGAVQRRRRRRGGADRVVGVPPRRSSRRQLPLDDADPDPVRRGHRLGLLLGLEHRLRASSRTDPEPADPAPGQQVDQRAAAGRDRRRAARS